MRKGGSLANGESGLRELVDLALTLRDLARGEDEEGRRALAWALVNRSSQERDRDRDFLLALAALCRALGGGESDPTGGAKYFHPHTENPDWAAGRSPSALAGGHLFYAPRIAGHHG